VIRSTTCTLCREERDAPNSVNSTASKDVLRSAQCCRHDQHWNCDQTRHGGQRSAVDAVVQAWQCVLVRAIPKDRTEKDSAAVSQRAKISSAPRLDASVLADNSAHIRTPLCLIAPQLPHHKLRSSRSTAIFAISSSGEQPSRSHKRHKRITCHLLHSRPHAVHCNIFRPSSGCQCSLLFCKPFFDDLHSCMHATMTARFECRSSICTRTTGCCYETRAAERVRDRPTNSWWPGHCDHTLTYTSHEVPQCAPTSAMVVPLTGKRMEKQPARQNIVVECILAKRCSWQGQLHELRRRCQPGSPRYIYTGVEIAPSI
jgi:hypothetical protein